MNQTADAPGTAESVAADRREHAPPKLVVVDLASVFPEWTGPVPPQELVARSALLRTLAEARRDGDVYLVGAPMHLAWAASEIFENSAVVVESEDPNVEKELSGQFLNYEETGRFGELVIVSGDRRFLDVIDQFKSEGRTVRVISAWDDCDLVLARNADLTVFFPSFEQNEAA